MLAQGDQATWPLNRAPGAVDDGSGSAAIMAVFESLLISEWLVA